MTPSCSCGGKMLDGAVERDNQCIAVYRECDSCKMVFIVSSTSYAVVTKAFSRNKQIIQERRID